MKHLLIIIIAILSYVPMGFAQRKAKESKAEKVSNQNTTEDIQDDRPVDPAKLIAVIKKADRIVVLQDSMHEDKELFSSTDPKDIEEFADAIAVIIPDAWFKCACADSLVVRLYRGESELAVITYLGHSIGSSLWSGDAVLSDPEKWLKWFDARMMTKPRKEYEQMVAGEKRYEASEARWLAAMPKSIQPQWSSVSMSTPPNTPDLGPLRVALAKEFPEIPSRILALLTWFGSGDGSWSGYPAYESIAEELLLDFSTTEIVSTVQSSSLTESQLEGTARLLGGWSFSKRRPNDLREVLSELKRILLEQSLKSTDADKRDRAKYAFEKR